MSESVSQARPAKIRANKRAVDAAIAAHAPGKWERHWFVDPPGMCLRITPNGTASYCLRFTKPDGSKGDYAIGQASKINPEQAQDGAKAHIAGLTLHRTDPVEARRAARIDAQKHKENTFGALAEAFMSAAEHRDWSTRTRGNNRWMLDKHVLPRIGGNPLGTLSRADIRQCIRDVQSGVKAPAVADAGADKAGNRQANMVQTLIRQVFNWAVEDERCDRNPAPAKRMFDDTPQKRIGALDDGRVGIAWWALTDERAKGWGVATAIAIQLCFVTLQRPNEVVSAHRDDFDWKARLWCIPADRTKTNTAYEVPLTDEAVSLFRTAFAMTNSQWAFPSEKDSREHLQPNALSHRWEKMRRRLVKAGGFPKGVQLYDARRFGRTRLEDLGVPENVAEKAINHAPDRRMAARYNVKDYGDDVREAHDTWARELRRIVQAPRQYNEAATGDPLMMAAE